MNINRIMWGGVSLVVLITIGVTFGTLDSHSKQHSTNQSQPSPTPEEKSFLEKLNSYAAVDFNAPEPENAVEREHRRLVNQRYDKQEWVIKNPMPNTGGVGRYDEIPPPPLIPTDESTLIVVGQILGSDAHLSNDKGGVYTEFDIQIIEILKNDSSAKTGNGKKVIADRAGGVVCYPNGQKLLYQLSERNLPQNGNSYIFFLRKDDKSPNYELLIAYGLKDEGISQLETGRSFDEFKNATKLSFLDEIRKKISASSKH